MCQHQWTASLGAVASEAPLPTEEPGIDFYNESNRKPAGPMDEDDGDGFGRTEPHLTGLRARPSRSQLPMPAPPAPVRKGASALSIFAWVLTLAVLGGAGYAAITWRTQVVAAWPPSERVFAALGLQ
jgi:hypothetical protein